MLGIGMQGMPDPHTLVRWGSLLQPQDTAGLRQGKGLPVVTNQAVDSLLTAPLCLGSRKGHFFQSRHVAEQSPQPGSGSGAGPPREGDHGGAGCESFRHFIRMDLGIKD